MSAPISNNIKPTHNTQHMKTLITITIAIATAAITSSSYARIGETREQAIARYGQPANVVVNNGWEWTQFRKGDFGVSVHFFDGRIDSIEYIKITGVFEGYYKTVELSEVETQNFLSANDSAWEANGHHLWVSPNLCALQEYNMSGTHWTHNYHRLLIMTREAIERADNQTAMQQTEAQAGF
jgi:hypothetical protein